MATAEDIAHWRKLVQIYERNIYHLENQMAALGPHTPPHVRAQHEENIADRDRYRKLIEQATMSQS